MSFCVFTLSVLGAACLFECKANNRHLKLMWQDHRVDDTRRCLWILPVQSRQGQWKQVLRTMPRRVWVSPMMETVNLWVICSISFLQNKKNPVVLKQFPAFQLCSFSCPFTDAPLRRGCFNLLYVPSANSSGFQAQFSTSCVTDSGPCSCLYDSLLDLFQYICAPLVWASPVQCCRCPTSAKQRGGNHLPQPAGGSMHFWSMNFFYGLNSRCWKESLNAASFWAIVCLLHAYWKPQCSWSGSTCWLCLLAGGCYSSSV